MHGNVFDLIKKNLFDRKILNLPSSPLSKPFCGISDFPACHKLHVISKKVGLPYPESNFILYFVP